MKSITHQGKKLTVCFYSHSWNRSLFICSTQIFHQKIIKLPSKDNWDILILNGYLSRSAAIPLSLLSIIPSHILWVGGLNLIRMQLSSFWLLFSFCAKYAVSFFFLVDWLTKITYFLLLILGDPMCSTRRPLLPPWEWVYNPKSVPLYHQPRGRIRYAMIKVQIHTRGRGAPQTEVLPVCS